MSRTYELIAESLGEIISDLEETGGKNLKREKMELEAENNVRAKKIVRLERIIHGTKRAGARKWITS